MTTGNTNDTASFSARHIGTDAAARAKMLAEIGYASLDELMAAAVPAGIVSAEALRLPEPASETEALAELAGLAGRNAPGVAMIGCGYHPTITPPVIRRNLLEAPAWYTAYTPYQPEISQGRLEALINFQTVVGDLTGLPTANASLLDEATAVVEAVMVMRRAGRSGSSRVLVDADTLPQTLAVLATRTEAVGIDVELVDLDAPLPSGEFFGLLASYPGCSGELRDLRPVVAEAHARGAAVAVTCDPLSLALLTPPGEMGADIAVGSTQRLGVPMFYGGPHAAFIAVRDGLERNLPGRLVGVSIDAAGQPAYRLALQTREQHIRRDRATSNICTAQVLLAITAGMYAVFHGPDGLRRIAEQVHAHTTALARQLAAHGVRRINRHYFDTLLIEVDDAGACIARAREAGVLLRPVDATHVGITCSEITTDAHVATVVTAVGRSGDAVEDDVDPVPGTLRRTSGFLEHPVFHQHRSETAMLRYLRALSDQDYALDRGMIPLGSCTMKLNATAEMEPISWPGFADLHPLAPLADVAGYRTLVEQLEEWLAEITGYAAVSIQPNAGSQGELAGLLAIRAYHRDRGEEQRDVCLIPASAHGTNAASAVLAGLRVVVVASRDDGTVDLDDLKALCAEHAARLAAVMVTYPSTHGVYETGISDLCDLVHDHGGQVYVDGANLNALIGIARPGEFGGDVSHLNLHKTFAIPHGGGGPGVGPVAVAAHLAPYLPSHPLHPVAEQRSGIGPISAAPYGSAGVLPIAWAYVRMMGADGLRRATQVAVLGANYLAHRLAPHFPLLYTADNGLVAHECIVDLRPLTADTGVTVDDVAKRLIDHGFHAPTMSFPVPGTLMIEPTESEDLAELDRFVAAMVAIRAEIDAVAAGRWTAEDSPLRHAPHTAACLVEEWTAPYSRREAVFPSGTTARKYWPPVRRVEQAYGDRNLVCSCPPLTDFEH